MEVSGQLHNPAALPLDGTQSQYRSNGDEKKIPSLFMLGIEPQSSSL
jgi:hypothetical protein